MIDLRSYDPKAARDLLTDMRAAAQERGKAVLWQEWASAVVNLTIELFSRDLEAARALLAAMWELWAKAAFNLMIHLHSRDPEAARALLDDMRGVAEKRDEAALWEVWATAAFNLR
jgi:hypothetical protein